MLSCAVGRLGLPPDGAHRVLPLHRAVPRKSAGVLPTLCFLAWSFVV